MKNNLSGDFKSPARNYGLKVHSGSFALQYQGNAQVQDIDFYQNALREITAQKGVLKGKIYHDVNGNGSEDPGEPGLEGVSVIFVNSMGNGQTVETDADGEWSVNVIGGSTLVLIDNTGFPPGAILTEGSEPLTINVISGGIVDAGKLGYAFIADISGHAYFDVNGNGIQDGLESDMSNVEVEVVDEYGISYMTVTDANGDWSVQQVVSGMTSVTINENDSNFPTGAFQTEGTNPSTHQLIAGDDLFTENDGFYESGEINGILYDDLNGNGTQDSGEPGIPGVEVDENDNDFPIGAVQTEGTNPTTIEVVNGETYEEVDGYMLQGELKGHVYFDVNGNGIQDGVEPDMPNVEVEVEDALGTIHTLVTDATGDWEVLTLPEGDAISTINVTDSNFPAGAYQSEGTNPTTSTIVSGETIEEIDGFYESGEINGILYDDLNGNGTQDSGEPGISGVEVLVTTSLGVGVPKITGLNGQYSLRVPEGTTVVEVNENDNDFPIGAVQTEGTNPTTIEVVNGESYEEVDGYMLQGELKGHVYFDVNGNGIQDGVEPDMPNVEVEVEDALGTIHTLVTDATGDWEVLTLPEGDAISTINVTDSNFPAGAYQSEGTNPTTSTIVSGETIEEIDGILYNDLNGNGTQDSGEPGIPGVEVLVTTSLGVGVPKITGLNGQYSLRVPEGTTVVEVNENDNDFPIGAVQTEGTNPTTIEVVNGESYEEVDGYHILEADETGILTGHLYHDVNGIQDSGEPGLSDIDVEITDSESTISIVTTDANGDWSIEIPVGTTISDIDEADPDFPALATQTEGTDPTTTEVLSNQTVLSDNDGFYIPDPSLIGEVEGRLYHDVNGNGTQDTGEPGLVDIDVMLTDDFGTQITVTTDVNGDWIGEIVAGTIESAIDQTDPDFPAGYVQTEGTDPTLTFAPPNQLTFTENDGFTDPNAAEKELVIYNAVSPDGNGKNDFFKIKGIEDFPENTVRIFNRQGVLVYKARSYDNTSIRFDGISDGNLTIQKSKQLPSGNYFYVLEYIDADGKGHKLTGYLYLAN